MAASLGAANARLTVGRRAPDLSGKTHDGKPFKLRSLRGKVVVIDFWGPG